jgi:putative addiction module component (TIGR02574 family)
MSAILTKAAQRLPVEERIALVEQIWDTIAAESENLELTAAQKQELDRRIDSFQENPHAGRTWEAIKSEFLDSE